MFRTAVTAVAILVATISACVAEPVTYRCSPIGETTRGEISATDELIVDVAVPSLELRVAASMDTDAPLNWLFSNRPDEGLGPDKIAMDVVFESTVGGGLRSSTAFSFILDSGDFALTMMSIYGVETYRWTCSA